MLRLEQTLHSFQQWNTSELCGVIVGTGAGKAFCAGGDVAGWWAIVSWLPIYQYDRQALSNTRRVKPRVLKPSISFSASTNRMHPIGSY
jgi:enoyl-CoA hydratase/carnithine racemase